MSLSLLKCILEFERIAHGNQLPSSPEIKIGSKNDLAKYEISVIRSCQSVLSYVVAVVFISTHPRERRKRTDEEMRSARLTALETFSLPRVLKQ